MCFDSLAVEYHYRSGGAGSIPAQNKLYSIGVKRLSGIARSACKNRRGILKMVLMKSSRSYG